MPSTHSIIENFDRFFIRQGCVGKHMPNTIQVRDLAETYSDGTKAVQGISFDVREGEFFGFLGPNGAGKSTAIKILTTLLQKTSGSVSIGGYDLDKNPRE